MERFTQILSGELLNFTYEDMVSGDQKISE
jgi:hypothetical protein